MGRENKTKKGGIVLFDDAGFKTAAAVVDASLQGYRTIPVVLNDYEDTAPFTNDADYVRGVVGGGVQFIVDHKEQRIRDGLKSISMSRASVDRIVEESLGEIPQMLKDRIEFCLEQARKGRLSPSDVIVSKNSDGNVSIDLREGYLEGIRGQYEHQLTNDIIEDFETARKAFSLIWELSDKGYLLADIPALVLGVPRMLPGVMSKMLSYKTEKERETALTDAGLFGLLHKAR